MRFPFLFVGVKGAHKLDLASEADCNDDGGVEYANFFKPLDLFGVTNTFFLQPALVGVKSCGGDGDTSRALDNDDDEEEISAFTFDAYDVEVNVSFSL